MDPVQLSAYTILLNEFAFPTLDYQPPHFPRSIAFADTAVASGSTVLMTRTVTDLGPMLGVWAPFHILCENVGPDTAGTVPYQGQRMYENLLHLYNDFLGTPITLMELQTGKTYQVAFTADGITPTFLQQPNQVVVDDITGDTIDCGPEYSVQVSFMEISV